MGNVYTIYSYFNTEQLVGVLNAIVMLMGVGDYGGLLRFGAIFGLFLAVAYGFVRARGEEAAYYILMLVIFYTTLFIPRVTVTVEDHSDFAPVAPVNVDNVPLGLAFFASVTSHIGKWLTESSETFFNLPNTELRLGRSGLMGASRALREAQGATIKNPILVQDITYFMRDCINPEIAGAPPKITALFDSTNLWADLGPGSSLNILNPGRMVTLASQTGAVGCAQAYALLNPMMTTEANSAMKRVARLLSPYNSESEAQTVLQSLLPVAEGMIMTTSASASDAIKQRMLINALDKTPANMGMILNDPASVQVAVGTAVAAANANSAYRVMANLAKDTLPLVRNTIELVVIGIFPIVLLLTIIAGSRGGAVLRSYVMAMFWVQLWAPLYAILNYVSTMMGARSMKAALMGIDGVTISNSANLLNTAISAESVAGMLTISIPMIAMAIIKGGEVAMSGIASSVTGPADRAANKAGEEVGSGNVRMGNTQWGTYTAYNQSSNRYDNAFNWSDPNSGYYRDANGSFNITEKGQARALKLDIGNTGTAASIERSEGLSNEDRSSTGTSVVTGERASTIKGKSAGYDTSNSAGMQSAITKRVGDTFGGKYGENFTDGAIKGVSAANRSNALETDKTQTQTKAGAGGNLGANLNGNIGYKGGQAPAGNQASGQQGAAANSVNINAGGRAGLGLDLGVGASEAKEVGSNKQLSAEDTKRVNKAWNEVKEFITRSYMSEGSSQGQRQAATQWLASFSERLNANYGTDVGVEERRSAETIRAERSDNGVRTSTNVNDLHEAVLINKNNGSPTQVLAAMSNTANRMEAGEGLGKALHQTRNNTDLSGQPLKPPESQQFVRSYGEQQINKEIGKGESKVGNAAQEFNDRVDWNRQNIGAPSSSYMPNDRQLQEKTKGGANELKKQREAVAKDTALNGGINRMIAFMSEDSSGVGRALRVVLGVNNSHDENRNKLIELARNDSEFEKRLIAIGNHGRLEESDKQYVRDRTDQWAKGKELVDKSVAGVTEGVANMYPGHFGREE